MRVIVRSCYARRFRPRPRRRIGGSGVARRATRRLRPRSSPHPGPPLSRGSGARRSAKAIRHRSLPARACSCTAAAIRRSCHRDRSRFGQGAVAADVSGAVREEPVRQPDGQGARTRRRSWPAISVYTLGVTGVLSAWRVADGTLAWRKDYSAAVDTSKLFCGTAMSPLIDRRPPDRPGRKRRARRASDRPRSRVRRRALDLEGPGAGLCVARRLHRQPVSGNSRRSPTSRSSAST